MPTLQILTKNNENTIRKTLESVKDLGFDMLIGDLGSTDKTIKICSEYDAEIVNVMTNEDFSSIRNDLVRDGLNMYLHPWEVLLKGHKKIRELEKSTHFFVVQNGILTKEIRLWKDKKFENPIYESITDEDAECDANIVIIADQEPDCSIEKIEICKKWLKKKPTSPEPYYYMAFSYLGARRVQEFMSFASQYLAMDERLSMSSIMIRYNIAKVQLYQGKLEEAAKNILTCVAFHPNFAEFWCLLGDIFYKQGKYEKAKHMYENAIIIGKRRLNTDKNPIEINKYDKYPKKMIANIDEIRKNTVLIGAKTVF